MALLQSLHERLVALASNGDDQQIVYRRIIDHLEDLQKFHQELVRTAESGDGKDPKMFEGKQNGVLTMSTPERSYNYTALEFLESFKNETLTQIKHLLDDFKNKYSNYQQIMKSKQCIFDHIKEIELQTKSESRVITHHVQNMINKCIKTKNDINTIVLNLERVSCTIGLSEKENSYCEDSMQIVEEQLNNFNMNILNELKNKILSIEKENQSTFSEFSRITSNNMNLQLKYDCIKKCYEICTKIFNKVSDFQEFCLQTGKNLDFKIKECESNISSISNQRELLKSEWSAFKIQSNEVSDSISKNMIEFIEMDKYLDELILQKKERLNHFNNEFQALCQSKQKLQESKNFKEEILKELNTTLAYIESTKEINKTKINAQNLLEKELLERIKYLLL